MPYEPLTRRGQTLGTAALVATGVALFCFYFLGQGPMYWVAEWMANNLGLYSYSLSFLLAFFPFGLILFNRFNCFFDFIHLKIRKFPIVVLSCEPKLAVMNLDAAHKFSEPRFVRVGKLSFQAVNTAFQQLCIFIRLATTEKYKCQGDSKGLFHGTCF